MMVTPAAESEAPKRRRVAGTSSFLRLEARVRERMLSLVGAAPVATLADAVGLNRESVRRALRGGHISLELVMRVCSKFEVRADWLLFGEGPRQSDGKRSESSSRGQGVGVLAHPRDAASSARPAEGPSQSELPAGQASIEDALATGSQHALEPTVGRS